MIVVSVCLPSDALSQHLQSYWGFSYLGCGTSLHGCSSKAQPLLLTVGYLPMAAPPDLGCWVSPFSPFSTVQGFFQKKTVPDCGQLKMASVKLGPADGSLRKMACLGCDVPIPGWFQQEKVMSGTDQKTPQGTSLVFQWLVKPLHFHCRGHWFDPCQGTKITAAWPKKKKKTLQTLS